MKVVYIILISFSVIACSDVDENGDKINNSIGNSSDAKVDPPAKDLISDKYNWEELLLTTGYVNDIQELSDFQNDQLELIRYNFPKIEKQAFDQANKLYAEYYEDTVPLKSLSISGVHIFNDTTEIIEFYFKSNNPNKTLVPVVLFKKFRLLGTTYID